MAIDFRSLPAETSAISWKDWIDIASFRGASVRTSRVLALALEHLAGTVIFLVTFHYAWLAYRRWHADDPVWLARYNAVEQVTFFAVIVIMVGHLLWKSVFSNKSHSGTNAPLLLAV